MGNRNSGRITEEKFVENVEFIFPLVLEGLSYSEIADRLGVEKQTVFVYVKRLREAGVLKYVSVPVKFKDRLVEGDVTLGEFLGQQKS